MTRFVQVGASVLKAGSPDPSCANRTAVYTDVPPVIQSDDFFKEVQSNLLFYGHPFAQSPPYLGLPLALDRWSAATWFHSWPTWVGRSYYRLRLPTENSVNLFPLTKS